MSINISKKDIIWSFISKFFNIGAGLIALPLILHLLTPEEIGMNYLMLTIGSIVSLLDFGFSPQFGRNFTYVNSGSQILKKEGVDRSENGQINYRLLSILIKTARFVYRRLSIFTLVLMLTLGTFYIYYVTKGFKNVNNSLIIWILYSVSTYFNVYYSYYSSLLTGSGLIKESCKAGIYSKVSYLFLCILLLLLNCGLFAVVFANFLSPFVQRYYSYRIYFTKELLSKIDNNITKEEINTTFRIIWYNAKKLGIHFVGSFATDKFSMFIIGFFLPLSTIGSYGLLCQLTTILQGVSITLFTTYLPKFSYYRVSNQNLIIELKKLFSFSVFVATLIMIVGAVSIIYIAPSLLRIINSNTMLPSTVLCAIYLFFIILQNNYSIFTTLITTDNEIPYVIPNLISAGFIVLFTFLSLKFTNMQLYGIVLSQGLVQLMYNYWRWPMWVFKDLKMSIGEFMYLGVSELSVKIKALNR